MIFSENNGTAAVKQFSVEYTEDANRTRCKTLQASVEEIFLERVAPDSRLKF